MTRILLIDDDRDQRQILSMLARKIGLSIATLNQFDAQAEDWSKYALVIVDAMMPIVSGPQLVREQAARLGKNMPRVILFSAMPMSQLQEIAAGLPNVELMTKTGSFDQIVEKIKGAARG